LPAWWEPIATTDSDTVQSMYDAAISILNSRYLPIVNRFNKPFIFSDVAYYSAESSARQLYGVYAPQIDDFSPADPTVPSDYDEQARAYQATLLAFAATPWVQGSYSFGYSYFNHDSKGYSVRAKTAEEIMSQIYQQINAGAPTAGSIPMPVITAVTNAAGGQPGVSSGSFVSIYGSNFTSLPYDDWSRSILNGQLPEELDGVRVTIGGKPAFINTVTPSQINMQAPDVSAGPAHVGPSGQRARR